MHKISRQCSGRGPRPALLCIVVVALLLMPWLARRPLAQSDLDAFMQQVLAERDSNWKKLQQYILAGLYAEDGNKDEAF